MKTLGEWRCISTHSLTSSLDGGEWSASRPSRFTRKERARGTHWIGGWVGPRAVLDAVVKRKIPSAHSYALLQVWIPEEIPPFLCYAHFHLHLAILYRIIELTLSQLAYISRRMKGNLMDKKGDALMYTLFLSSSLLPTSSIHSFWIFFFFIGTSACLLPDLFTSCPSIFF
jgi:hypothetical protein